MNTLRCAWLLAKKDLRCYFRDLGALAVGFLVPIALVTVFGWIMTAISGGGGGGMPQATLYVVDEAATDESRAFVERLRKSNMLRIEPKLTANPLSRSDVEKKVADGDTSHALVIPSGFALANAAADAPKLIMFRDPGRKMEQQIIQIGLFQTAMAESNGTLWWNGLRKTLVEAGLSNEQVAQVQVPANSMTDLIGEFLGTEEESKEPTPTVKADGESTPNTKNETAPLASNSQDAAGKNQNSAETDNTEDEDPMAGMMGFMLNMIPLDDKPIEPPSRPRRVTYQAAQSVAGMTVMSLLFALTGCASVLLAEREKGTLRRLFAMAIPRESVLFGKLMFAAIIGVIQVTILFVYGELMFKVGLFRDPVTLSVLVLTWVAAASSFGMLIASAARSSSQGDGLAQVVILVMAALGGCWFPLQMMKLPLVLDMASKSMMTYWAMSGFQGMLWNQLDLTNSKMQIALAWQWGWAIVLMSLAIFFFRRNYCRD
jgi:ABC-type transport system involved in multi-copper enzyme maturation permease subunit